MATAEPGSLQMRRQSLLVHASPPLLLPQLLRMLQAKLRSRGRLFLALSGTAATLLVALAVRLVIAVAFRRENLMADPTFGSDFKITYDRNRFDESWEDFMNGMGLPRDSAVRGHVRQLFNQQRLEEQLRQLFHVLARGAERLESTDVERFSRGVRGNMRVLLQTKRFPLADATQEDERWIAEGFEKVFPPEAPLDHDVFPSFAKLVLIRRVVRTLIDNVGLERLQEGVTQPLVVDIRVELGGGTLPFRLHTVAPKSIQSISSGTSLGQLTESEEEGECGEPSPSTFTRRKPRSGAANPQSFDA